MQSTNDVFDATFVENDQNAAGSIEAIQLEHLEKHVRFSLKHCQTDKKHCIKNVAKDSSLLKSLYKKLGHFEDMTWRDISSLARESGISVEKRDTKNFKDLKQLHEQFMTFGHFRVSASKKSVFRVFGAIQKDFFYILQFDVDGKNNHK